MDDKEFKEKQQNVYPPEIIDFYSSCEEAGVDPYNLKVIPTKATLESLNKALDKVFIELGWAIDQTGV